MEHGRLLLSHTEVLLHVISDVDGCSGACTGTNTAHLCLSRTTYGYAPSPTPEVASRGSKAAGLLFPRRISTSIERIFQYDTDTPSAAQSQALQSAECLLRFRLLYKPLGVPRHYVCHLPPPVTFYVNFPRSTQNLWDLCCITSQNLLLHHNNAWISMSWNVARENPCAVSRNNKLCDVTQWKSQRF